MATCHHWCLMLALLVAGAHSRLSTETTETVSTAASITVSPALTATPRPTPTKSHSSVAAPPQTTVHTTSQVATTSSGHMTSSSKIVPAPTSVPSKDFISYTSQLLYLKIHNISITFYSSNYTNLTGASFDTMKFLNNTVVSDSKKYTLTRFYGTKDKPVFFIRFHFEKSRDGGWYLQNLQHAKLGGKTVSIFLYTGIQYSIWAPPQLRYSCNRLTLHGSNGLVTTSVSLMNISVQPFLVNGHYSSEVVDCAGRSSNNETIGLVIGLSLSLAVVIAAIIIIISILVSRKLKNRGYDILKD